MGPFEEVQTVIGRYELFEASALGPGVVGAVAFPVLFLIIWLQRLRGRQGS